jgi:transposase
MNRAKVGAEAAAATHESTLQRNSDMGALPGTQHCNDDCMQAMSIGRRRWMNQGLWWQRNAVSTLQALGFWVRGSEPFKVHQVKEKAIATTKKKHCER